MDMKRLQMILQIDPHLENIIFYSDKQRLSQVLINLLSNALKFTNRGYIKVKASVLSIQLNDNNFESVSDAYNKNSITYLIRVCVTDTGIGIKEEDQGKLFKFFGKVGQDNEVINPTGIGLGLTI